MKRSTDRILTTHVGSLPRPADLLPLIRAKERGQSYDPTAFAARVRGAVTDIVRRQTGLGVDVVDDGEMGKPGFIHYANDRLAGFELLEEAVGSPWKDSREVKSFPEFYDWFGRTYPSPAIAARHMVCTGPITYKGHGARSGRHREPEGGAERPADRRRRSCRRSPDQRRGLAAEPVLPTQEEYVFAIAEAMREEYKAIVDAGFILQIDDPHSSCCYVMHADMSIEECRKWAGVRIEALNHALRDMPRERVRWHTCYGIDIGPRCTTSSSRRSWTSCCRSTPGRTRSKRRTRATSTNGGCGKDVEAAGGHDPHSRRDHALDRAGEHPE